MRVNLWNLWLNRLRQQTEWTFDIETEPTMTPERAISLAALYVDRANAHELDRIFPMFAADATYYSIYTGECAGRRNIAGMMKGFFARFPDVQWEVAEYQATTERIVEFTFRRRATDTESGRKIDADGRERIIFSHDGLILRIEVGPKEG